MIDLSPKNLVDFRDCRRIEHHDIMPTPFGQERAREAWVAAQKIARYGPVSDQLDKVLTLGERAYVQAVWDDIPSGGSCWMTAFWHIERGEILP